MLDFIVVLGLQAADFLADEAAVTATCQELGHRLFRTEQQPMESSLATQSLTESSAASTVPETGFSSFSTSSGDTVEGPVDSVRASSTNNSVLHIP